MFTSLDRWTVIFKFPLLRFNFYQGLPPRRQPVAPNIFLRSFFPSFDGTYSPPLCTHFFIIKTRSGVAELDVANPRCHNKTESYYATADSQHRIF